MSDPRRVRAGRDRSLRFEAMTTIELRVYSGATPRVEPVSATLTDEQRAALGRAPWDLAAIETLCRWGYDVLVRSERSEVVIERDTARLDIDEALRTLDPSRFYALGAKLAKPSAPNATRALSIAMGLGEDEVQRFIERCRTWRFLEGSGAVSAVLPSGERARLEPSKKRVKRADELWELFAARSVIPMEFTEVPRFTSDRKRAKTAPSSMKMAVAIARNPSLVTQVDALAREFAARAAPFGVSAIERVLWLEGPIDILAGSGFAVLPQWCGVFSMVLPGNDPRAARARDEFDRGSGKRQCSIDDAVSYAMAASTGIAMNDTVLAWCESVCAALGITAYVDWARGLRTPKGLAGRALNPACNPFVPLVQIELEGATLEQITKGSAIACLPKE
jgi:hypothetical protein